jgi:hypothetical protein
MITGELYQAIKLADSIFNPNGMRRTKNIKRIFIG